MNDDAGVGGWLTGWVWLTCGLVGLGWLTSEWHGVACPRGRSHSVAPHSPLIAIGRMKPVQRVVAVWLYDDDVPMILKIILLALAARLWERSRRDARSEALSAGRLEGDGQHIDLLAGLATVKWYERPSPGHLVVARMIAMGTIVLESGQCLCPHRLDLAAQLGVTTHGLFLQWMGAHHTCVSCDELCSESHVKASMRFGLESVELIMFARMVNTPGLIDRPDALAAAMQWITAAGQTPDSWPVSIVRAMVHAFTRQAVPPPVVWKSSAKVSHVLLTASEVASMGLQHEPPVNGARDVFVNRRSDYGVRRAPSTAAAAAAAAAADRDDACSTAADGRPVGARAAAARSSSALLTSSNKRHRADNQLP
jgi:hypothetical protein